MRNELLKWAEERQKESEIGYHFYQELLDKLAEVEKELASRPVESLERYLPIKRHQFPDITGEGVFIELADALSALQSLAADKEREVQEWFNIAHDEMAKVSELQSEVERLKELKELYKGYAQLLSEELDEVVPWVNPHQWRSTRVEKGKEFRDKIAQLEPSKQ